MLSKGTSFFQHANLNVTEIASGMVVGLDHARESDRARKARRPTADEENIHWHRFGIGRFAQDQSIERERSLVDYRKDFTVAIGHWWWLGWTRGGHPNGVSWPRALLG